MLTEKQLAMRRNGISSSEVAGLLGLSPFTDPVKIWIDKCAPHLSVRSDDKGFSRINMGNIMEPVVAKCYCLEFNLTYKKYVDTIAHDRIKWMMCTPDFDLSNGRGLECKNVSAQKAYEWGPSGTDLIPIYYIPQVQQCMAVLDRQDWAAAAIIGGTDFRHYLIERDEELIGLMIEAQEKFWTDYIVPKKMPPAEMGPSSAKEYLEKRFPAQKSKATIEVTKEHPLFYPMDRIRELRKGKAIIQEEYDLMVSKLKIAIQDGYRAQYGKGKGSISASWGSGGKVSVTDWEAVAKDMLALLEDDADFAKFIAKHTQQFDKKRRFTVTVKGEEKEESEGDLE